MKHYLSGITIAAFVAYIVFTVADRQLGITARINNAITGQTQ